MHIEEVYVVSFDMGAKEGQDSDEPVMVVVKHEPNGITIIKALHGPEVNDIYRALTGKNPSDVDQLGQNFAEGFIEVIKKTDKPNPILKEFQRLVNEKQIKFPKEEF